MPEKYIDWSYEDLPEQAKKAATAMGYDTQESWDEDHKVPFDTKPFADLTLTEKRAAFYLGIKVLDKKLDIWWEDTDDDVKEAALAVGFSEKTWDDDWRIEDFPIEHKYWKDLTDEEKAGATFFGYTGVTWDQTGGDFEDDGKPAPKMKKTRKNKVKPTSEESEEDEESEEEAEDGDDAAAAKTKRKKTKKKRFGVSKYFGGETGGAFNDQNHRNISKIIVSSGLTVDSIEIEYAAAGVTQKHGGDGGRSHTLELGPGEYVNKVVVRHANLVQCLTFMTNKGNKLGPCGGRGRPIIDKKGEETTVAAPPGTKLCGVMGRTGKLLDAIAFRWGPI